MCKHTSFLPLTVSSFLPGLTDTFLIVGNLGQGWDYSNTFLIVGNLGYGWDYSNTFLIVGNLG